MSHKFIPSHGGYKSLISYKKAEMVYDATIYFTNRFYKRGDRTIDQMVQAARSGKQICQLEEEFLENGRLREQMTQAHLVARKKT